MKEGKKLFIFFKICFVIFFLGSSIPLNSKLARLKITNTSDSINYDSKSRLLVDFIGNWSNLDNFAANTRHFTSYTINPDIKMFGASTFELIGNGWLMFNLTKHDCEINLPRGHGLLFHWMDFGELEYATYIGARVGIKTDLEEFYWIYIAKAYSSSGYSNSSPAVLKFANPTIELGNYWEQWGIELDPFFDFFQTSSMTLVSVSFVHQSTISYNGPRFVRYSQPLITEELPRSSESQGAFLGIYNESYPEEPGNETIILEDSFNELNNWIITNPGVITRNDTLGAPPPSVEIRSTLTQRGVCKQEIFLPELQEKEYIRTSVDFFIPEHQIGSISVITGSDSSSVLFPFQIRIYNVSKVRFTIYEQPPDYPQLQTWHDFPFEVKKWYNFNIYTYTDHFSLEINGIHITSSNSQSYHSSWTDICFGDGSDRATSTEQGHYFWDNIQVSLGEDVPLSSSTSMSSSLTNPSSSIKSSSLSLTSKKDNYPNITGWNFPTFTLIFIVFGHIWLRRRKSRT
ncbi:MAG: hypothetical protein ACFFDC_07255 [Promethearchaeota archaeon]